MRTICFCLPFFTLHMLAQKPDLTISDMWTQNSLLFYQLVNVGDAAATPGHVTSMTIDGQLQANDTVLQSIPPGSRLTSSFQIPWQCFGNEDMITLMADAGDILQEVKEGNNTRSETWPCDVLAPWILSGPTVSGITPIKATVTWDTNEASTSTVHYDHRAGDLMFESTNASLVTHHVIVLTGLQPYTVYRVRVTSTDSSGNSVESGIVTFSTQIEPDTTPPSVQMESISDTDELPLYFMAEAEDDTGVDRVAFFINDELVETDGTAPYMMTVDPVDLGMSEQTFYNELELRSRAYDRANRATDITVTMDLPKPCPIDTFDFMSPLQGETIYVHGAAVPAGTPDIPVVVYAYALAFNQMEDRWYRPIGRQDNVERIELYIDGVLEKTEYNTNELLYDWSPVGQTIGDVDFQCKIFHGVDCVPVTETHVLHVRQYYPDLRIRSRTITRSGTLFNVELNLKNEGTAALTLHSVEDTLYGFKAVPIDTASLSVHGRFDPLTWVENVTIERNTILSPNESITLEYQAVPVMFPIDIAYAMGTDPVLATYNYAGTNGSVQRDLLHSAHIFDARVDTATELSNYLMVTSPAALLSLYLDDEVYELMDAAALLAVERDAVFGYFLGQPMLRTSLDSTDHARMGNIYGAQWSQELFVTDHRNDLIHAYTGLRRFDIDMPGLSSSDAFAVGNVITHTGLSPHNLDDIVIGDAEGPGGEVTVYLFNNALPGYETITRYLLWEPGDLLLTGDVRGGSGDPEDELLIIKSSGTVRVCYNAAFHSTSFSTDYEPGDFLMVGDLIGNGLQELIIGDVSENQIRVFDGDGVEQATINMPVGHTLIALDKLNAGRVYDEPKDQILRMSLAENRVYVYGYDPTSTTLSHYEDFDLQVGLWDVLLVGNIFDSPNDEIIVGRAEAHSHYSQGQIEVFPFEHDMPIADRHMLDRFLNPDGDWARRLDSRWCENGYLLIIGETEIVPAFSTSYELSHETYAIESTDNFYADTAGVLKEPEIATGRIVGNNPVVMRQQIERTLEVIAGTIDFDQSDALVIAGRNRGMSGNADYINFTLERVDVREILEGKGFLVAQLEDPGVTEIFDAADNKDIIHLAGHGGTRSWDAIVADDVVANFDPGASAPLVYGSSCLTGKYTVWDPSLAETFIEHGASAYIGATENAIFPYAKYLAKGFYDRFDLGTPAGLALKNAKIARMGTTAYGSYNSAIFHLYGDPMLEPQSVDKRESPVFDLPIPGPLSSLQVTIPDVDIQSSEFDEVNIPGGEMLMVIGHPMVPSYTVEIDYPVGTQVQDVTLISKANLSYLQELDIQDTETAIMGSLTKKNTSTPAPGHWPPYDFDWEVRERPDGSSNLVITTYPFHYSPLTQEALFFQLYDYAIEYTSSPLLVRRFESQKSQYDLGEPIPIELIIENTGSSADYYVAFTLQSLDDEITYGLPIARLRKVLGLFSFEGLFAPPAEAGGYILQAIVSKKSGEIHARASSHISVGNARGAVTDLDVNPKCFDEGQSVQLAASFLNTGDKPLSGRIEMHIIDRWNETELVMQHPFTDLAPGAEASLNELWLATSLYARMHFAVTAHFDGRSAPAVVYRFPTDPADILDDLPTWPEQRDITDLIRGLFCDL